jgi:putative addiction module component (TIGR02574 family)
MERKLHWNVQYQTQHSLQKRSVMALDSDLPNNFMLAKISLNHSYLSFDIANQDIKQDRIMTTQAMKICQAAEQLSPIERIEVIEHLFYSLDSKSEREKIDSSWAEESELRLSAYERGEMNVIPAEEVFKKLESKRK